MTTDQIAAEAWDNAYKAHNEQPSYGRAAAISIIKSAIDSAITQPKQIPLTDGKFATVDHQDFVSLAGLTWHCTSQGRAATGRTNYMHKVIAAQMGIVGEVDHIDGNPLNNRRSNLRGCTRSQNLANSPKCRGSTSQYKGVHWSESHLGWVAQIKQNGKMKYLGQFGSEVEAAVCYDQAAKEKYKEFARLNFPFVQQLIEKSTAGVIQHFGIHHIPGALKANPATASEPWIGGNCSYCGGKEGKHRDNCRKPDSASTPSGDAEKWTEETVKELWEKSGFDDDFLPSKRFRQIVADTHNATLQPQSDDTKGESASAHEIARIPTL